MYFILFLLFSVANANQACTEGMVVGPVGPLTYYAELGGSNGHVTGITKTECESLVETNNWILNDLTDSTRPYGCIVLGNSIGFNQIGTGPCNHLDVLCVQKNENPCYDDNTDDLKARYKERYQELNGCTLT